MAFPSRISVLSDTIQTQTQAIDQYLSANGFPEPSFKLGAPFVLPLSPELGAAQSQLVEAATELLSLISGPVPYLTNLLAPMTLILTSMHAIHKFRVAHNLKPDEQISHRELAEKCGLDETDLSRIIRQSIAWQIFCEPKKGFVAHNAVSLSMVQMPFLDDYLGCFFEIGQPAAAKGALQMQKWPGSQDSSHHGYALATGAEGIMFDILKTRPSEAVMYTNTMQFFGANPMLHVSNCVRDLGWAESEIPETIVDVGGAHGVLCAEVLRAYPSIKRGIVQDLSDVVSRSEVPADLQSRLEFQVHDFLTPQVGFADVYILRFILHDWAEREAIQILRNFLPALRRGARLIINEIVLLEPGQASVSEERMCRSLDMVMKTLTNSRERDMDAWNALFNAADPNLNIVGMRRTPPALPSVIEVKYMDSEDVGGK